MARGKYAVKSAQNRAENAGLRAEHLKQDLDDERKQHAVEVSALKATVEKLSAQLTGAVADLAAEEVRRVEANCAEQIRAERDRHRDAALESFRRIGKAIVFHAPSNTWHIPGDDVRVLIGELAKLFDVPAGEADEAAARQAGAGTTRDQRRADAKRHKASATGQQYVVLRGVR